MSRTLRAVPDDVPLREHLRRGFHEGGTLPPEDTWGQLIWETIDAVYRPGGVDPAFHIALKGALEQIASDGRPSRKWRNTKRYILEHIDCLSFWSESPQRLMIIEYRAMKRDGKYYATIDGEEVEIVGIKTEQEERQRFISGAFTAHYGGLMPLISLMALVNICMDIVAHPTEYPSSVRLHLPENHGWTAFSHWAWIVKWPYRPRAFAWRPKSVFCNPEWLASDLLVAFAEKEGLDGPFDQIGSWKGEAEEWAGIFSGYSGQLELALDTPIQFGEGTEVLIRFEGLPCRWINQTDTHYTRLVVPLAGASILEDKRERALAMRLLSWTSFEMRRPIRVVASAGGPCRFAPILGQTRALGRIIESVDRIADGPKASIPARKALALAFFREGESSPGPYYCFFSFYKIIQLAFGEKGERIGEWIDATVPTLKDTVARRRLDEIQATNEPISKYLYNSGRCAIAHVRENVVDPDDPDDEERIRKDIPIVRGLARQAIVSGLVD